MRFPAPRAAAARTAAAAKADWPVAFASDPDVRHSDSALPWMYSLRVRRRSRRRSPGSTLLIFASLVEFTLHFFPELTERFLLLADYRFMALDVHLLMLKILKHDIDDRQEDCWV